MQIKGKNMIDTLVEFITQAKAFFISATAGVLLYISSYYQCVQDKDCEAKFYIGLMVTKLLASGFVGYIAEPILDPGSQWYGFYLACIGAGSFKILEVMGDKAEKILKDK